MFFTGRRLDAAEALRIGLVNRVADGAELAGAARRVHDRDHHGRAAHHQGRQADHPGSVEARSPTFDVDMCRRLILDCFESEDYAEGRRAFMEKRKPVFKGK